MRLVNTDPTGTGGYQVAAFSLGLSLPPISGVTFTSADINTATTYIFVDSATLNGGGPLALDTFPTTSLTASDSEFAMLGYRLINPGDQFGVAHIGYSADATATPGPLTPTLVPDATSLADPSGNVPTPIPEPSSGAFVLACCVAWSMSRKRATRGFAAQRVLQHPSSRNDPSTS